MTWVRKRGPSIFFCNYRSPLFLLGRSAESSVCIELGLFEGGQSAVNDALASLKSEFGPDGYNIMTNNCNHFSDALCRRLLQRAIPGLPAL